MRRGRNAGVGKDDEHNGQKDLKRERECVCVCGRGWVREREREKVGNRPTERAASDGYREMETGPEREGERERELDRQRKTPQDNT